MNLMLVFILVCQFLIRYSFVTSFTNSIHRLLPRSVHRSVILLIIVWQFILSKS